jgi:minichromosome maintenance protein 10
MLVIGRSFDLGMCRATRRDGTLCNSWCDKRVGDVCEWHVQNAVESRRAARAEFSVG